MQKVFTVVTPLGFVLFSLFVLASFAQTFGQNESSLAETVQSDNTYPDNNSAINSIDEYSHYFAAVTQKSVNLTKDYQDNVGKWKLGQISNASMAKLTNDYLKNFTTQLNEFNQTNAPKPFEATKNSMSNSFSNEIKSYEFFRDYLTTGNETKNQISTDYLSKSLEDEFDAFKSFNNVVNTTLSEPSSGLST